MTIRLAPAPRLLGTALSALLLAAACLTAAAPEKAPCTVCAITEGAGAEPVRATAIERAEQRAGRLAALLLWVLAAYAAFHASRRLLGYGERAGESGLGVAITIGALTVMPLLARGKLRVAGALGSRALRTDAYEAVCCAWLSATTRAGLGLNAAFGWWWGRPAGSTGHRSAAGP